MHDAEKKMEGEIWRGRSKVGREWGREGKVRGPERASERQESVGWREVEHSRLALFSYTIISPLFEVEFFFKWKPDRV